MDIREADVPYYIRAAIDQGVRVGLWYDVLPVEGGMWHCLASTKRLDISQGSYLLCKFNADFQVMSFASSMMSTVPNLVFVLLI